jgi:hypothetical protein
MAFFHRPSARPDTRLLEWKVGLFASGAVLALAGMYLDLRWMVGLAIGVLVAGFALRFTPRPNEDALEEEDEDRAGA